MVSEDALDAAHMFVELNFEDKVLFFHYIAKLMAHDMGHVAAVDFWERVGAAASVELDSFPNTQDMFAALEWGGYKKCLTPRSIALS